MSARGDIPRHGAVLLAAGTSRRLGQPKQLIEVAGEPLLRRAAQALLASGPGDCVVVLGHDAPRIGAVLAGLPLRRIVIADYATGMSAALRAGIAALDARCDAALVALCDQPALDVAHLCALRDAWRRQPTRAIASAYAGVLGVPALLPRACFEVIATLGGDIGAREWLRTNASEVVAIAAPQLAFDIDRLADLDQPDLDRGRAPSATSAK